MDKPRLSHAHQGMIVVGPPRPARSALLAAAKGASAPSACDDMVASRRLRHSTDRVSATAAPPPTTTLRPQVVRPARALENRAPRPSVNAVQRALASDKGSVLRTALSVSLITDAMRVATVAGTATAVVEAVKRKRSRMTAEQRALLVSHEDVQAYQLEKAAEWLADELPPSAVHRLLGGDRGLEQVPEPADRRAAQGRLGRLIPRDSEGPSRS